MFRTEIKAAGVVPALKKHMLIDGFEVILDLEKSHGSWLTDGRDNREYVDFFTGVASMPIGWNHPKLTSDEVIYRLGRLAINKPTNSDIYCEPMAAFVETFFRVAVPDYLTHAFFVEGGTVGVENALKAAFDWKVQKNFARGFTPEKGYPDGKGHQVLHFNECFHGRTGYTMSMTDSPDPNKTKWYPKFDWPRITTPKCLFPLTGANLEKTIASEQQAVREIEAALLARPHEIAALILEPIQGEGGDNHFRPEFFQTLRRLADEHEFLLIFDEVQTGVGLTGRMWAHQNYGVRADMITFGKKTQVCGFLAGPRIDEVPGNVFATSSRINSTWGGNLIDMARSQLYFEVIEEERLVENAAREGEWLQSELRRLSATYDGLIENPRGLGLLCAFDLTDRLDRKRLLAETLNAGVIMLPCGKRSMRFRPSLNIPREVLAEGLKRLETAIQAAAKPETANA